MARRKNNPNDVTVTNEIQGVPFNNEIVTRDLNLRLELNRQYITGANWQPYPAVRTLSQEADEFTCKLGLDTLRKMMQDSEISASIGIYLSGIFSRDLEFISPIDDADSPFYDAGKKIASIANMLKKEANFSWEEELKIATRTFLGYGTSAIEHNIEWTSGIGLNGYIITNIANLGIRDFRVAVNNFSKPIGIVPFYNGYSLYSNVNGYLPILASGDLDGIIPLEKFSFYAFNRQGQDARGSAITIPAYPSWWLKQQLLLEFSAYIKRFAPILYGVVGEKAITTTETINGQKVVTNPVDNLNKALVRLHNGSVGAFAHGTELGVLDLSKSGDFFISAIKLLDLQSARAITRQHLASGEGEHQARSASEVHQDILILGIKEIKEFLSRFTRLGTMRTWTIANFGIDAAFLTPIPSFGRGSGIPLSVADVAELHKIGYLTAEQYPQTDAILELTPRASETVETGKKLLEDSDVSEQTKEQIAKALKLFNMKKGELPNA